MLRHLVIFAVGLGWGAIALGLMRAFGLPSEDVTELALRFFAASVFTSYAVTLLFRRHLYGTNVKEKYWLPFATIPAGVVIWTVVLFTASGVTRLVTGASGSFDGVGLFLGVGLVVCLTVALPIVYPAAYLTQLAVARWTSGERE